MAEAWETSERSVSRKMRKQRQGAETDENLSGLLCE